MSPFALFITTTIAVLLLTLSSCPPTAQGVHNLQEQMSKMKQKMDQEFAQLKKKSHSRGHGQEEEQRQEEELAVSFSGSNNHENESEQQQQHPCSKIHLAKLKAKEVLAHQLQQQSNHQNLNVNLKNSKKNSKLSKSSSKTELTQAKFAVAILSPQGVFSASNSHADADADTGAGAGADDGEKQQFRGKRFNSEKKQQPASPEIQEHETGHPFSPGLEDVDLRYIDTALMLVEGLKSLGHDAVFTTRFDLMDEPENRQYIVLGAHHLNDADADFSQEDKQFIEKILDASIIYNIELLDSVGDQLITPEYIDLMKGRCVWDPSSVNAMKLTEMVGQESSVKHVALPFSYWLSREYRGTVPPGLITKDIDILFLGKLTHRAKEMLSAVERAGVSVYAIDGGDSDLDYRSRDALLSRAKSVVLLHTGDYDATVTKSIDSEKGIEDESMLDENVVPELIIDIDSENAKMKRDSGQGFGNHNDGDVKFSASAKKSVKDVVGFGPDWPLMNYLLANRICIIAEKVFQGTFSKHVSQEQYHAHFESTSDPLDKDKSGKSFRSTSSSSSSFSSSSSSSFSSSSSSSSSSSMYSASGSFVDDASLLSDLSDSGGILLFDGAQQLVEIATRLFGSTEGADELDAVSKRGQEIIEQLDVSVNMKGSLAPLLSPSNLQFSQRFVEAKALLDEFEFRESEERYYNDDDDDDDDRHNSSNNDDDDDAAVVRHNTQSHRHATPHQQQQKLHNAHNHHQQQDHRNKPGHQSRDAAERKMLQHQRNMALAERASLLLSSLATDAPKVADAHLAYGIALYNMRVYKDAIKSLKRALKLAPNDPVVYERMGSVYFAMREFNEAKDHFLAAIETIEENELNHGAFLGVCPVYPLIQLAEAYIETESYEELAATVTRLMECAPGNRDALLAFAWASVSLELPENVEWVMQQLSSFDGAESDLGELQKSLEELRSSSNF